MFKLPETTTNVGVVVALGKTVDKVVFKPGVKVYYSTSKTEKIQFENEECILVDVDSVFGVIEE